MVGTTMIDQSLERQFLEENVWRRRDVAATVEQEDEVRQATVAFQHARVLMSRARMRAEVYLQRN